MKTCQVCVHRERTKIEALVAGGQTLAAVSKRFGVHQCALSRHMNGTPKTPPHVSAAEMSVYLAGTADVLKLRLIASEQSGAVLEDFNVARSMTLRAMQEASSVKDWTRYASVVGRFIEILDRIGRTTGEIMRINPQIIDQSVTNNYTTVLNAPEWLGVQKTVLSALLPFPEARVAVVAALRGLDGPPQIEAHADAA